MVQMKTSSDTDSLNKPATDTSSTAPSTAAAQKSSSSSSWRDKLHFGSKPEEHGKESWRDASLSEEERWKGWQKAKDKEQRDGGATGVFTAPYKAKGAGKLGYWLSALW